jgi:hypothetical protein
MQTPTALLHTAANASLSEAFWTVCTRMALCREMPPCMNGFLLCAAAASQRLMLWEGHRPQKKHVTYRLAVAAAVTKCERAIKPRTTRTSPAVVAACERSILRSDGQTVAGGNGRRLHAVGDRMMLGVLLRELCVVVHQQLIQCVDA